MTEFRPGKIAAGPDVDDDLVRSDGLVGESDLRAAIYARVGERFRPGVRARGGDSRKIVGEDLEVSGGVVEAILGRWMSSEIAGSVVAIIEHDVEVTGRREGEVVIRVTAGRAR